MHKGVNYFGSIRALFHVRKNGYVPSCLLTHTAPENMLVWASCHFGLGLVMLEFLAPDKVFVHLGTLTAFKQSKTSLLLVSTILSCVLSAVQ
jgi:hypothetical protein